MSSERGPFASVLPSALVLPSASVLPFASVLPSVRPGQEEPRHHLAGRWLIAFRSVDRVAAGVVLRGAELLLSLQVERAHEACGFVSFMDFGREVLQLSPRTTKRRLALARIFATAGSLRDAFLERRLSACQVLALRPLAESPALPFWIELAATVPVRDLVARVRAACSGDVDVGGGATEAIGSDVTNALGAGPTQPSIDSADPMPQRITFAVPTPAALVWDAGLAAARRVLGWNAPAAVCLEAILTGARGVFETEGSVPEGLVPDGTIADGTIEHNPTSDTPPTVSPHSMFAHPPKARPLSPEAVAQIRQTLALVERETESLSQALGQKPPAGEAGETPDRRLGRGAPNPALATLDAYRALIGADRRLRLLQGLLLRELWTHDLHRDLGSPSLVDFAETHLGLSERTARGLVSEAFLFQDNPLLAEAFRKGRIGVTQARQVRLVALNRTLSAHIARAEGVTVREFERETRFLERLAEAAPAVWARHPGPLPDPGLEASLLEGLTRRGVNRTEILKDLEARGLGDGSPEGESTGNPDENPNGDPDEVTCQHPGNGPNGDPAVDPRLMTRLETVLDRWILETYVEAHPDGRVPSTNRQMLAPSGWTTITFYAPPDLLESWNQALHRLRTTRGPLPPWACMVLLVREALKEWLTTDPATRPAEHRILERDDYLCRAPGCSSRRNLEVHHIRYRSQGGTDEPENKITLCHTHHHHAVHAGTIRLRGRAPGNLTWEMGTQGNHAPLFILEGERILRRPAPIEPAPRRSNFPD